MYQKIVLPFICRCEYSNPLFISLIFDSFNGFVNVVGVVAEKAPLLKAVHTNIRNNVSKMIQMIIKT